MLLKIQKTNFSLTFNQKLGLTIVASIFAVAIGLLVAQLKGTIDMVKFGRTVEGKITYSLVGGSLGAMILGCLWICRKTPPAPIDKRVSNDSSPSAAPLPKNDLVVANVPNEANVFNEANDPNLECSWVFYDTPGRKTVDQVYQPRTSGTPGSPLGPTTDNGECVEYTIWQLSYAQTKVTCRSNATVGQLRQCLAAQMNLKEKNIQLCVNSDELSDDKVLNKISWPSKPFIRRILCKIV